MRRLLYNGKKSRGFPYIRIYAFFSLSLSLSYTLFLCASEERRKRTFVASAHRSNFSSQLEWLFPLLLAIVAAGCCTAYHSFPPCVSLTFQKPRLLFFQFFSLDVTAAASAGTSGRQSLILALATQHTCLLHNCRHWFSPTPDAVSFSLRRAVLFKPGFSRCRASKGIRATYSASRALTSGRCWSWFSVGDVLLLVCMSRALFQKREIFT